MLDTLLEDFPKHLVVRTGPGFELRPLQAQDEPCFHRFLLAVPPLERLFIKQRVADQSVIHEWCQEIDFDHNLPLLAWADGRVIASACLHQQLGGWKRHVGRVGVLVHPEFRGLGLVRALALEMIVLAENVGLDKVEAEFVSEQRADMRSFGLLGFIPLVRLYDYVKDMDGNTHDYVLMGLDLRTAEEYAGVG